MLTVILDPADGAGITAWTTSGSITAAMQEVEVSDDEQAQSRQKAILAEYAEAAEIEVAENAEALDVPLNLRITKGLDAQLCQRAAAEQIPTSALVRRLLTGAV